jgi:hypothetical protein
MVYDISYNIHVWLDGSWVYYMSKDLQTSGVIQQSSRVLHS